MYVRVQVQILNRPTATGLTVEQVLADKILVFLRQVLTFLMRRYVPVPCAPSVQDACVCLEMLASVLRCLRAAFFLVAAFLIHGRRAQETTRFASFAHALTCAPAPTMQEHPRLDAYMEKRLDLECTM